MVDVLLWNGYEVIRFNSGSMVKEYTKKNGEDKRYYVRFYIWFGKVGQKRSAGVPDLLAIGNGDLFFLEAKFEDGEVRKEQEEFAGMCAKNGIPVYFPRTVDDVLKIIKERKGE
jgi:hypothetical protein